MGGCAYAVTGRAGVGSERVDVLGPDVSLPVADDVPASADAAGRVSDAATHDSPGRCARRGGLRRDFLRGSRAATLHPATGGFFFAVLAVLSDVFAVPVFGGFVYASCVCFCFAVVESGRLGSGLSRPLRCVGFFRLPAVAVPRRPDNAGRDRFRDAVRQGDEARPMRNSRVNLARFLRPVGRTLAADLPPNYFERKLLRKLQDEALKASMTRPYLPPTA